MADLFISYPQRERALMLPIKERLDLVNLRERIGAHIEADGKAIGAAKVDQSAFKHLEQFDALAGHNVHAVFAEMEFE